MSRLCYNSSPGNSWRRTAGSFPAISKRLFPLLFAAKAAGSSTKVAVDSWTLRARLPSSASAMACRKSGSPWPSNPRRLPLRTPHNFIRLRLKNLRSGFSPLLLQISARAAGCTSLPVARRRQRQRLNWFANITSSPARRIVIASFRDARAITAAHLARCPSAAMSLAGRPTSPSSPIGATSRRASAITARSKKRFRSANSLAPTTCKLIWMEAKKRMPPLLFSNPLLARRSVLPCRRMVTFHVSPKSAAKTGYFSSPTKS